jgi:hypothetical protein
MIRQTDGQPGGLTKDRADADVDAGAYFNQASLVFFL